MEELLAQISTAATSGNLVSIRKSAQDASEFLSLQQGLMRDPAHELREKCMKVIQLCLESKKNKFTAMAITCCHRLLKDDRFHSNFESQDDSTWLLGQLLQATSTFLNHTDDTQVDILKVFLNVACGNVWNMNSRLIIAVLSLCSEAYESGNAAVRTAAQAAACQTLRSFSSQLEDEMTVEDVEASAFNEIIPIMQFLCSRVDSSECAARCEHGVLFLLECLLTLLSSMPPTVHANPHLRMFLWQKLVPVLISVLGTPRVDKHITTRADSEGEWGRGSGCLSAAPTFSSLHARAVYSISTELVRLVGSIPSLRPMLESLFHRILLYPAPAHRLDALRSTAELLRSPLRLLDIAGPFLGSEGQPDMALIRLMMDSIEECRKSDLSLMSSAVSCAAALLKALEELCQGNCLPTIAVEHILKLLPTLLLCEYSGASYYQSVKRLPPAYQHSIQLEKDAANNRTCEDSDSSGIGQKSDCSGDTEGPESLELEIEDSPLDTPIEFGRLDKLPKTLGLEILDLPIGLGDSERQHARHFIGALHDLLNVLQPIWCLAQIDRAIQTFASQYCQGVVRDQPITEWGIIVNADGIYLTTLSALLLDFKLFKSGYYAAADQTPHLTEDEFVQQVQSSGVLVYLSGTWLREVYQAVVSGSLLHAHGYLPTNSHSLINLLTDIGGLGTWQQGCEMMWEVRRLDHVAQTSEPSPEVSAGLKLARLLLTCCWTSLLRVLAAPLSAKPGRGKRRQTLLRETIACSLEGLQGAARLCTLLGVQDRSDLILELLCSASCSYTPAKRLLTSKDTTPRLTVPTALSLELILQQGLELGSHCPDCWPHVFRSVLFVRRMERATVNAKGGLDLAVSPPGGQDSVPQDDDEVDVYSFLRSSSGEQMVSRYIKTAGFVDTLTASQTANVLTLLSYMAVELTVDAAYKLNLNALESFARCLCSASHLQLYPPARPKNIPTAAYWIHKLLSSQDQNDVQTYLLDAVGDLMVKCVRICRPLAHIMRIWAIVGPHLTQAACHSDPVVSKKAIELIEAVINNHIKQEAELPYFHFNEALFKPFENILCLELCDNDVQDQIVSCICEFVEGSAADVRSGWRALFGALRAATCTSTEPSTIFEVFSLYLNTKSPLVFCSAALDCILCLLKHVRNPLLSHRKTSLEFLQRCEEVLDAVYAMPQPLVFQAAHRIHISDGLLIEPDTTNPILIPFETIPSDLQNLPMFSYRNLAINKNETSLNLEKLDRPSGVLRVWFLLLEGLYSAAIAADIEAQSLLLDAVFSDVKSLLIKSEPEFGIFCINRMLLPATQTWLRRLWREGSFEMSGPKQALGLLSDLTLTCFKQWHKNEALQTEVTLLLKQLLLLLVECAPYPPTASTSPACFRHIIMNIGDLLSPKQWQITVLALRRCFEVTLVPLRQILMAFSPGSQSFYGDYDQVKVAARRDSTAREVMQLKHLSQQVFLLDGQREDVGANADSEVIGERSYTFLLNPSIDPQSSLVQRVPLKHLVTSLLTHQALLQVLASILLQGSTHVVPSLVNVLLSSNYSPSSESPLPGLLRFMPTEDILVLLDCLDLSYRSALQFDGRPGLKFLVQKVAGLERAANLYRQAGAAWAVKVVVLFELCLYHAKKRNISSDDLKSLLQSKTEDSDLMTYVTRLEDNFNELCDTYIEVVLDQDGTHSAVDMAPDQPIMFLIACQDEQISPVQPRKSDSKVFEDNRRPFLFSDFAETVSVSSSDESDVVIDDGAEEECEDGGGVEDQTSQFEQSFTEKIKKEEKGEQDEEDGARKELENKSEGDNAEKGRNKENEEYYGAEKENEEENEKDDGAIVIAMEGGEQEVREKAKDEHKAEDHIGENEQNPLEKKPSVNVAKNSDISNKEAMTAALNEYKKSKNKQRMNPFNPPVESSIPPEIEAQRRNSFLKDSEAHRRVRAEMLDAVFELFAQLPDDDFRTLLPLHFNGIRRLTAHATDPALKQSVAQLFSRIALVYGFGANAE